MLLAALADDSIVRDDSRAVPLRDKLRQATDAEHRRLDARFSSFDLTTLSGYRRFLTASAAALIPLETAVEHAGIAGFLPDWPQRTRRAAILSDLACLDTTPAPACAVGRLSRNAATGVSYVLEGSRLGAKFLLRAIAGAGDPGIAAATRYLRHGAGARLWPTFLHALEREPVTAAAEAEMIAGARLGFATFADAARRI